MEVKSHQVITAKCLEFSFEDFWCHVALEMTMLFAELCLTLDGYMHSEVTTAIHAATKCFSSVYHRVPLRPFCQGTWRFIMN